MLYYINLSLKSHKNIPRDNSYIFQTLHGMFSVLEYQYGIAYETSTLQVFSSDEYAIYQLTKLIGANPSICDIMYVSSINNVDLTNYTSKWRSYSRYKIPTRKADRHIGDPLRRARMQYADSVNMLYFNIKSQSNKTSFRYYVNITEYDTNPNMPFDLVSNGYGVSTATKFYMLPICPVMSK